LTGRQGQTALFLAVESGRKDVVQYLLEHGARTDVKDDMGRTPMEIVQIDRAGDVETVAILALLRNARAHGN